ncbi:hypothetical protein F5B17DRAFT_421295 [Nemania serpens]|nr:hypothetical protein F5B17DRAFT_421295 [Nemania serpens]
MGFWLGNLQILSGIYFLKLILNSFASNYALKLSLFASSRFSGSMLTFSFLGLILFAIRMLIPLFLTRPITIRWREV